MQTQVQDNKVAIINKIQALDFMLTSLDKVHKDNEKEIATMIKKISTRKLLLMDELFKLIS